METKKEQFFLMPVISSSIFLGLAASLISALTALVVAKHCHSGSEVLYVLLVQYFIGSVINFRFGALKLKVSYHLLRLALGLWSFGGYFLALSQPGSSAATVSMILNSAPVLAVFFAPTGFRSKFGAFLAFVGLVIAVSLSSQTEMQLAFNLPLILVATAACAYAASFILLGVMRQAGESSRGINSTYNMSAFLVILLVLIFGKCSLPSTILPLVGVAGMSALRLQIITAAAKSPVISARVAVLANLSFLWLALYELVLGGRQSIYYWLGMLLVAVGSVSSQIPRGWLERRWRVKVKRILPV